MKTNLIKRVSAWMLGAALAVSSYTLTGVTMVNAASLNLISKQTDHHGYTTTYSYNKNGLISKAVARYSEKTDASYNSDLNIDNVAEDREITSTTTYKYNKNNKISNKTEKKVTATSYRQMDEKTGLSVVADLGTITTTETTVTVFTYNKKGLATQSVSTTTKGMTGSISGTGKTSVVSLKGYKELDDGRVLAGYNEYDEKGEPVSEDTIANAYFLSNPSELDPVQVNSTIAYTDKGKGEYVRENTVTTINTGYQIVEEKKDVGGQEIITSVRVTPNTGGDYTSTNVYHNEYVNKKVVTTKYSYDSKNRVKKRVSTTVSSEAVDDTNTYSNEKYETEKTNYTDSGFRNRLGKRYTADESTTVSTTTFSYDKNGRATKSIVTNEGVKNSKHTTSSDTGSILIVYDNSDYVRTYKDGKPSENMKSETTWSNIMFDYRTVTAEGVESKTTTYIPFNRTVIVGGDTTITPYHWDPQIGGFVKGTGEAYTTEAATEPVIATPSKETKKYTYDKRGNLKSVRTTVTTTTVDNAKNPVYGNIIYEINEKNKAVEKKEVRTNTNDRLTTYESIINNNCLTEIYNMNRETYNRAEKSSYSLGHRIFSFKKKNVKADKVAKKQQWIIQNATLKGEIGLT